MSNKLKKFLEYIKENTNSNVSEFTYLILEKLPNGLKVSLTEEGKQEVADWNESEIEDDRKLYDLFDDVQGNSEYKFVFDLGEAGFGLTQASGITDGYYYDDKGDLTDKGHSDSEVYYHNNYAYHSILWYILQDGYIILNKA